MVRNVIFARIFEPIFSIVAMQGVEALLLKRRHQNNPLETGDPVVVRQSQMESSVREIRARTAVLPRSCSPGDPVLGRFSVIRVSGGGSH